MIGGPNGAGKTTAARRLVPKGLGIREFVNADEIARGLSPFNPEGSARAAGRLMLLSATIDDGSAFWRPIVTNFTAQEMIKRIARSLELTREEFAKPASKATASKITRGPARSATAKKEIEREQRSKGLGPAKQAQDALILLPTR